MKRWYPVHTKPRQEKTAQENLLRQNYQVYLPLIRVKKFSRNKWVKSIEPLFPRYLFAHLNIDEQNIAPIRSTRGVAGLIKFANKAIPVPDHIIEYFKSSADPETGIVPFHDPAIRPGAKVIITAGPLHGMEAVFESVSGQDRAMILIDVLGRFNKVAVKRQDISPT